MRVGAVLPLLAALAALSLLLLGAQAQRATPLYNIVVRAADSACLEVPVSLTIPRRLGGALGPILRQVEPPADLPCQAQDVGDRVKLTWIVRDLPQGESRQYQLRFSAEVLQPLGVQLTEADGVAEVKIGDQLFTRYITNAGPKPYCWPIIGPTGLPVTRSYPMKDDVEGEAKDHPHQRSFWFTHGEVNGVDFWAEGPGKGKQVHREFEALDGGSVYGLIRASNDWIAPDAKKVCEDVRELRIYNVQNGRLLDFEITIKATEGPVEFGDTKEGTLGFRVAETMRQDRGGHIRNSEGQQDGDCWAKRAAWVDYYGPVGDETVGIAILESPQNFRYPTYWHVRTYGLYAVNPFGLRDFIGDKTGQGRYTIAQGGSLTLRYRIYIHKGDTEQAKVAQGFATYAHPPEVQVR